MFETLSTKFSEVLEPLRTRQLTENNIQEALTSVRTALIEADVSISVIAQFVEDVKSKAIGTRVARQIQAGDAFIKLVHETLVEIMGESSSRLELVGGSQPNVILMAGLQGVGKTTTVVKLAKFLKEREKRTVSVVSADIYRPAAIEQLRILANDAQIRFIPSTERDSPSTIVKDAFADAKKAVDDVLIVDTAGRLAIDEEMMSELTNLHKQLSPQETLFVVDAMTGQDAALTASAFHHALPLTGVILSKADGDARGGAALSVRSITGKPIKFLGVGESLDALEPFHPDRIASRILGMGDLLSFIEEAERKVDKKKAERLTKKVFSRKKFTMQDMREQLQQFIDMGGMSGFQNLLPTMGMNDARTKNIDEEQFHKQCVIIDSMTRQERNFPDKIDQSRKLRIAKGSGTRIQDVSFTIRKYKQMEKQMKRAGKKKDMFKNLQALSDQMGKSS